LIPKVVWHPGSLYDNYLVVLTSDNFLRIYDLENLDEGSIKAEQVKINSWSQSTKLYRRPFYGSYIIVLFILAEISKFKGCF